MSDESSANSSDTKTAAAEANAGAAKPASDGATASDSDSSPSAGSTSASEKSSRESVGGAKEVHYGYFSNVRTPKYRSGWDDIWGGNEENGAQRPEAAAKPARPRAPVRLTFSFDDLPEAVRDGLRDAASSALKATSRLNLGKREKAGAVTWTIECEVRR